MNGYKRRRAPERYAVLRGELAQQRLVIWDVVTETRGAWHRYQRSQLFGGPDERRAYRAAVTLGLRRFSEELTTLLMRIGGELDRMARERMSEDPCGLIDEMSIVAQGVRPRVIPAGLRYTLTRYVAAARCRPETLRDDELRVLAVGLWGLWDACEDGVREFEIWLKGMGE